MVLMVLALLSCVSLSAVAADEPGGVLPTASEAPIERVDKSDQVDAEREALANIAHELVLLKGQVQDASRSAPTMARVQFRYDWLESDLDLIERAIREHLDAPRQPRAIPALKGDYRH
jgi:RAQPRD family integrative conjugative element protein